MKTTTTTALKISIDKASKQISLSPDWTEKSGFEPHEISYESFVNILHPRNRRQILHWLQDERSAKPAPLELTIRYVNADLQWRWARLHASQDEKTIQVSVLALEGDHESNEAIRLDLLETMYAAWRRIASPIQSEDSKAKIKRILRRLKEELVVGRVVLTSAGKVYSLVGKEGQGEELLEFESDFLKQMPDSSEGKQSLKHQQLTPLSFDMLQPQVGRCQLIAGCVIGDPRLGLRLHASCQESLRPPLDETEMQLLQWAGERIISFIQVLEREDRFKQLQQFERRVKAIANTVFDAVVTIDQDGIVQEWNDKAEEMFGYKYEEAFGQRMSELIVPETYRQAHERGMAKFRKTGEGPVLGSRIEIIAQKRDATIFPVELAITPIDLGGRHIFTGYLRDISYRKEAEQRREKLLGELENANQELKDFAYIVSHDLKAPLRAIGSLTDWLCEDYRDQLDEDGQEQMQLLQDRVRRMYRLIEGILAYSRIGRSEEHRELVDFNEVISDVMLGLEVPANFEIILEMELPSLIWDRTRAYQVVQNLISNAIKYNDKEEGWIKIRGKDQRTHYRIDFEDNGKGIEKKYYRKIFQIFQTLQARDEFDSTGIGLTLVKKIVEMHGGSISVDSRPGIGTTFSLKLRKTEKMA